MQITLLTHERELTRKDNTGKLVLKLLGTRASLIEWKRREPNKELLELLKSPNTALLYPNPQSSSPNIKDIETFILIDSTWQEARKIYQKSPYLISAPKLTLQIEKPSIYTLRINQREGGLCTAEVVAEILRAKGEVELAEKLEIRLKEFIENREDLL